MWDRLTPGDIERVKAEVGERRAEILARHAEELEGLDNDQAFVKTLERPSRPLCRNSIGHPPRTLL